MKRVGLVLLTGLVVLGSLHAESDFRQQVRDLTNSNRAANGLPALIKHNQLDRTAQKFAEAMANQDFYSHDGPDGSQPWDRAADEGYASGFVGENIAAGYITPDSVVTGWMNSEGHRANILKPEYKAIGVGYFEIKPDPGSVTFERYWVQVFGDSIVGADQGDDGSGGGTDGGGNDASLSKPKIVKATMGAAMKLRVQRTGTIDRFQVTGTLPKGVKFNKKKGIFRGKPRENGRFVVFVQGDTSEGPTNRVRVVLRIR